MGDDILMTIHSDAVVRAAMDRMRRLLVDMKKADGEERAKVAWQTLLKYLGNIVKNPDEEKFRNIKLSNEAFQKRVGSATGGIEFMEVSGFQARSPFLLLYPSTPTIKPV
jgi:hypothetical protein